MCDDDKNMQKHMLIVNFTNLRFSVFSQLAGMAVKRLHL